VTVLRGLMRAWRAWLTQGRLQELPDYMLRDIGLRRDQIELAELPRR
jgi:uncharacterized protein YjiS (DUF1127 family)